MCLFKINNLKIDKKPTNDIFSNWKGRHFYHAGKQNSYQKFNRIDLPTRVFHMINNR